MHIYLYITIKEFNVSRILQRIIMHLHLPPIFGWCTYSTVFVVIFHQQKDHHWVDSTTFLVGNSQHHQVMGSHDPHMNSAQTKGNNGRMYFWKLIWNQSIKVCKMMCLLKQVIFRVHLLWFMTGSLIMALTWGCSIQDATRIHIKEGIVFPSTGQWSSHKCRISKPAI